MKTNDWTMNGSCGELIYGTRHDPELASQDSPRGVVLMAHGFKGYKDYGMFPWLATQFAHVGYIVQRFNFANSGMLGGDGLFERPDLFEQATWNNQVEDLKILAESFQQTDIPLILFGHSRGGAATLLATGRGDIEASGVISLSAPSQCNSLTPDEQQRLLDEGRIESPSGRTGQMLYVGKNFLEEQLNSPEMHDLQQLIAGSTLPCLLIHGEVDQTVGIDAAKQLEAALKDSTLAIIAGGDHVYNTPNPFSIDDEPSPQLRNVWNAILSWLP